MKVAIIVLVIIGILDAFLVIMCAKMERKGANEVSRYIDADATRDLLIRSISLTNGIDTALKEAPSIDIVFCAECRECVEKGAGIDCPSGYGYLYCRRKKSIVDEDDYCSWGERR